ncbi:MAG: hypothetical protein Q9217_000435 [Psora testacea]
MSRRAAANAATRSDDEEPNTPKLKIGSIPPDSSTASSRLRQTKYRNAGGESLSLLPAVANPHSHPHPHHRQHDGYQPFPEWLADVNEPDVVDALREFWDPWLPISINLGKFEFGIADSLPEFVQEVGHDWALKCLNLRLGLNMTNLALQIQHPPAGGGGGGGEPCDETFDEIAQATGLQIGDAWRALSQMHKGLIARALRADDNPIIALGVLLEHWFSEGHGAAGFMLACAETAVRRETISGAGIVVQQQQQQQQQGGGGIAVDNILVKAQMERWYHSYDWTDAKFAAMFVMTLAASKERMLEVSETIARGAMASSGNPRSKSSASLREAVEKARVAAVEEDQCTVIGVKICDAGFDRLYAQDSRVYDIYITFSHWLVLGICRQGLRTWQAGGREGKFTLQEYCLAKGDALLSWDESKKFIEQFEAFASPDAGQKGPAGEVSVGAEAGRGNWNKGRLKAYERVTGIDLRKARDRGMRELLVEFEVRVELIVLEDVKRADIVKFVWM